MRNNASSPFSVVPALFRLIRPKQWVKNSFVLAPLVFAGQFTNLLAVSEALLATLLFSLASSAAYILNDFHDIEHDRKHPIKSKRPLASGQVSKPQALVLFGALSGVLIWGYVQRPSVMLVIVAYLALSLSYTFVLKHQPVIDIFSIALGFVLRVYAGAVAISVSVSAWMFVTMLCLALYLASVKRRQELRLSGREGRLVLEQYSITLVDRYAEMAATGALLFYSLFVLTVRPEMVISIPFVLYGLFRYWFVVEACKRGESPADVLLSDWQLLTTVLIWLGICAWVLWPTGA
ncbi:MAG: decaprenyl-phosphate phosphoribosyltransferase [Desulfurellaceae bacterium]|nr:decaprenyl-phosphate phosphoribosyltransferase [Desulfurellaceae bacterium]